MSLILNEVERHCNKMLRSTVSDAAKSNSGSKLNSPFQWHRPGRYELEGSLFQLNGHFCMLTASQATDYCSEDECAVKWWRTTIFITFHKYKVVGGYFNKSNSMVAAVWIEEDLPRTSSSNITTYEQFVVKMYMTLIFGLQNQLSSNVDMCLSNKHTVLPIRWQ